MAEYSAAELISSLRGGVPVGIPSSKIASLVISRAPRGEVRHAERDTRAIETDGHDGMVGAFHHAEVKSLASTSDSGPSQKCRPMLGGTR